MGKDYYHILGVTKGAGPEEIKRAFHKLAHQYHPDKAGGNEEKFKEINEAYQVLSDPQKRAQYDQFGSAAFEQGGFGAGAQGFSGFDFSGFSGPEDLGDLFGDMFGFGGGARGSRSRRARGADIQVDVDLDFHEAVFGGEKEMSVTKFSSCRRCGGSGGEPGTDVKTCGTCGGSGVIVRAQRTILGTVQSRHTCPDCAGEGSIPSKPCSSCAGEGVEKQRKTLIVSIPSGVEDGNTLRLRKEGETVKGGSSGDLFVRLHVRPHKHFHKEGNTIYSKRSIGFTQAALGDKIEVETVDGVVTLTIPAGTSSGTQFRLRGKGVPMRSGRGDHIVEVSVLTPKKLSKEQKQFLEMLNLREP
jgi:molecular chaperone DnaJ